MPSTLQDARRLRPVAPLADLDLPESMISPPAPAVADPAGAADLFRILSDPTRLCILAILARKPHNVTDLRKRLCIPQPTTSHHLNQLRRFDLVASRRAGKQVIYSLGPCLHADGDGCLHLDTCVPGTRLELSLRPDAGATRPPTDRAAAVAQAVAKAWPV